MAEIMLPLPGLSPVNGKALSALFDGGALTSDAGLLALREVERRLDVAGRLAAGIDDPRDPARTVHSVADILRFRMLLIAAGYEDDCRATTTLTGVLPHLDMFPWDMLSPHQECCQGLPTGSCGHACLSVRAVCVVRVHDQRSRAFATPRLQSPLDRTDQTVRIAASVGGL
jgi:hypothetical protein